MLVLSKFKYVFNAYPITRGMATYVLTWPIASIIQQSMTGKTNYDWKEAAKFGMYGSLWVAPTLYAWVRLTGILWPAMTLKTAIYKVSLEQITYAPFGITSFLYLINVLDGKNSFECLEEVKQKLIPTYKTGACFWPAIQLISYSVVPEKNRVVLSSFASLLWTVYLAHVKHSTGIRPLKNDDVISIKQL